MARTIVAAAVVTLLAGACSAQEPSAIATPRQDTLAHTAMFGAFTYGGVWQGMEPVLELESELGRRLDIVHWFTSWDHPLYPEMVEAASRGGRVPLVSWQPHDQSIQAIAAGQHDDYVRTWARAAASANGTIYLRPFPEMNGNWTPWNGDPTTLRTAWRRIHDIFQQEGATNVRWVFSPNVSDEPRTQTNQLENYYPGHDVVDILALDGYNWGDTRPHIGWRDFDTIFHTAYQRITQLGNQPVWIAEIASSDVGGNKSAWVEQMFATTDYDRIEAIVWFDQDKEADWRIDSDPTVLTAFREALSAGAAVTAER